MIVVATLNIQLAAAANINSIIGLFGEDERPLDVLCVQELGLDVPSAPTFVSMAQGAGLHVSLGSAESGKHRVAIISRIAGKAVHMCSDRAAAACFQLLCNGSLTKVLISSFYGCVHDEDAALHPRAGKFTEKAAESRKRDFEQSTTTLSAEGLDPGMNEAMMRYHSTITSVLPNMNELFEHCNIFYGQVLAETAHQQVTNEPVVAPLQSLEKSRANKRILTHELPAFTSKKALDSNICHFLTGAGLDEDGMSALHNHLVGSSSATVRAEFFREQDAQNS